MSSRTPTALSFCVMPSRFLRRDAPSGFDSWDDAAKEAVDDNTLFYDVFQSADPGTVYAVGPALKRTFRDFLKRSQLSLDGAPAIIREISKSRRACLIEISAPVTDARVLSITHPKLSLTVAISPSHLPSFAGLDTMFTLSRNNTLDWVRDWARYHVEMQGVEGIVLYDNASDHYGTDALCDVLSRVNGLKAFAVVPAPFQYGPVGMSRERTNARYLQFGLFEITRLRFLSRAAGVLNVDIDEMAYGPTAQTVFEAARSSDAGFLTLPGSWRYPQPGAPQSHASHILRRAYEGQDVDEPMYPKWCLIPDGAQYGKSWRTHGIKGLPDQMQDGYGFFHCRMISENWHYDRSEYKGLALEPDPLATTILASAFSVPTVEAE